VAMTSEESLLARIVALEKENEELKKKNSTSNQVSPQLQNSVNTDLNYDESGHQSCILESNVYFDGFRTRVSNLSMENIPRYPEDQSNVSRISSMQYINDEQNQIPLEGQHQLFGGVVLRTARGSGRMYRSTSSTNHKSPQDASSRLSFKPRQMNRSNGCTYAEGRWKSEEGQCYNSAETDPGDDDTTGLSDFTTEYGSNGSGGLKRNSSYSGRGSDANGVENGIVEKRIARPNMSQARKWSSTINPSCNGDWNRDTAVHFTIGNNKSNRYSIASVQNLLNPMRIETFDQQSGDDRSESERPLPSISQIGPKSMSQNDAGKVGSDAPKLNEGKRFSIDKQLPTDGRTLQNIALFMKLTAMTKSLAKSSWPKEALCFRQFSLLTVDPTSVPKDADPIFSWRDSGGRFLDPLSTKISRCIDSFPADAMDDNLDAMALSTFCFPEGVFVRLIPQKVKVEAARLGMIGKKADEYKLLAFTDGNGFTTHGIALTFFDEISPKVPGVRNFIDLLKNRRQMRMSAVRISRWWRCLLGAKKLKVDESESSSSQSPPVKKKHRHKIHGKVRAIPKAVQSKLKKCASPSNNPKLLRRHSSIETEGRQKGDIITNRADMLRNSLTLMSTKFKKSDGKSEIRNEILKDVVSDITSASLHDSNTEIIYKHFSEKTRRLGKESFEAMEAFSFDEACFIQKCYVMVGGPQQEQFLQMRSLQHIVNVDRGDIIGETNSHDFEKGKGKGIFEGNHLLRHKFLHFIQRSMVLSPAQARIRLPDSDIDIILERPKTFDSEIPALNGVSTISVPLPLPHLAADWGVATLLQLIEADSLLTILQLILIERSILILGECSGIVTSCTCALLELIRPYKWASNFMPILPKDMIEFVNSPVPFIAGVVASRKDIVSIERDERVLNAMSEGLTIVNLVTSEIHVTSERGIKSIMRSCPSPCAKLMRYKKRLEELREADPSLQSIPNFLDNGFSRKVVVAIRAVKSLIESHMTSFSGDISSNWQNYGDLRHSDDGQTFEFYPSKFIEPLRLQLESRLQLQEMMYHSQLFIEYVDERRKLHLSRQELAKRDDVGVFLALWIWCRWKLRKKLN